MRPSLSALAFIASFALSSTVSGQQFERVRLITDHALSPDGATLAFSWRGDIWVASSLGGDIRRLTHNPNQNRSPAWSPDGARIAFISSRTGSNQIFVMPSWGGPPRQATQHTEGYSLLSYAPGGQSFLALVNRDAFWRGGHRLILQPDDGGKAPRVLFDDYGQDADLSPDGERLLFTREGAPTYRKRYKGSQESQVWMFELSTRKFTLLHEGEGGSRSPRWLPDGRSYIYTSQASGTFNLQRVRLADGKRETLTRFEGDGVLFPAVAAKTPLVVFRRGFDLMRLDLATGDLRQIELHYASDPTLPEVRRVNTTTASDSAFSGDGLEIAFIADGDLFVMDTELREPVRITRTAAAERSPVFSKDWKTVYFVSDDPLHSNIFAASGKDPEKPLWLNREFEIQALTDDEHSKSDLQLYDQGNRLAFYRGTDVASLDLGTREVTTLIQSWTRPDYRFSPDERYLAYSVQDGNYNWDVWIKPVDGSREPYNVSVHPDNDRNPVWSADGTILAFTGKRWGDETDIVYVYLTDADNEKTQRQRQIEKALAKMKEREKKPSGAKPEPAQKTVEPPAAPAADPISGVWTGEVNGPAPIPPSGLPITMDVTLEADGSITGSISTALGTSQIISGRYDSASKTLYLKCLFEEEEFDVKGTLSNGEAKGTWQSDFAEGTWSAARKEARGHAAPARAAEPAKKPGGVEVDIDFDGLRDRLRRISIPNSTERGLIFAPAGGTLYFQATVDKESGTFSVEFPDRLTPRKVNGSIPGSGVWLDDKKRMAATVGGRPTLITTAGAATSFNFTVRTEENLRDFHAALFDQAWRSMRDGFYDPAMGGNDWNRVREIYRPLAYECLDASSLRDLVNMMLGELNASHLGFNYRGVLPDAPRVDQWQPATGHLGARFVEDHGGPGLLIRDVIRRTPASRKDSRLEAGETILTVDGREVDPGMDMSAIFTHLPDHEFALTVLGRDGSVRDVRIRPASYGQVRSQLYEEWIDFCRAKVEELSSGALGYVHIAGMGGPNLQRFEEEIFRVGYGKDGLVIDVRNNGGGSITDHLLTMLTQPTHAITKTRDGPTGYPHDRRVYATWDKPVIVLCNQNSFSNAEIFSHAIQVLGRGKVVGVPTAGGVISTGSASLMGGASIRMPGRGWYGIRSGEDMELHGCVPDFVIWPLPEEWPKGIDRQLEKAVEELLKEAEAEKRKPRPALRKASER